MSFLPDRHAKSTARHNDQGALKGKTNRDAEHGGNSELKVLLCNVDKANLSPSVDMMMCCAEVNAAIKNKEPVPGAHLDMLLTFWQQQS